MKPAIRTIFIIGASIAIIILLPLSLANVGAELRLVTSNTQPSVAIVFGAAVRGNITPSAILKRRLNEAIDLYRSEKITDILVSGDNRSEAYNEPFVMGQYLRSEFIPGEAITQDFGGRSTYDTCWRAYHVFGVTSAYIVTQAFHVPRAHRICSAIGIKSVPAPTGPLISRDAIWGTIREVPAMWLSEYHLYIAKDAEVVGDGSEPEI